MDREKWIPPRKNVKSWIITGKLRYIWSRKNKLHEFEFANLKYETIRSLLNE